MPDLPQLVRDPSPPATNDAASSLPALTRDTPPSTTAGGLAASFTRGLAPIAAGAGAGALMGGIPTGGVGAIPGAIAGGAAAGLGEFGGDIYNAAARVAGYPKAQITTLQDAMDKVLDKIGLRRPSTGMEGVAETLGGALPFGGVTMAGMGRASADKIANMAAAADSPKTVQAAKAVADEYYALAKSSGGELTPQFTNKFVDSIGKLAPQTAEGRVFAGDTPITTLAQRANALRDKPLTLQGVQEIDESLGDMIDKEWDVKGLSKAGRNLLELQSKFRGMIADADASEVAGGPEGFNALVNGRSAWAQAAKMNDLERIATRAAQTDNPATAVKSGIRALTSNPERVRGYSKEELAALKEAGNRGVIGSALHVFGSRLGPWVGAGLGAHAAGPVGGVAGALATHGLTSVARDLASKSQLGKLQSAISRIGSGVPPLPPQ
jgi:hypothetical protein